MKRSPLKVAEEADQFFLNKSPIHDTMVRLAERLDELGIPFAIAGAMAVNVHGHRRTTADVDVLIRREDLAEFKQAWLGRGWTENIAGSKGFRDAETNVKVDALIVGDFPGDGKEKPVSFPAPESVCEKIDNLAFVNLPTLIELKLASGMTAPHRPRDLDDVIQLIRVNRLPVEYSEKLNPYVQEEFRRLWQAAQHEEDY